MFSCAGIHIFMSSVVQHYPGQCVYSILLRIIKYLNAKHLYLLIANLFIFQHLHKLFQRVVTSLFSWKDWQTKSEKTNVCRTEGFHTSHLPGYIFSNFMPHLLKSLSTQNLTVQLYANHAFLWPGVPRMTVEIPLLK